MTTHTDGRATKRTDEHGAMLKEALARPSVREVMEVYGGWRRADRALEAYRAAARERGSSRPPAARTLCWKRDDVHGGLESRPTIVGFNLPALAPAPGRLNARTSEVRLKWSDE